MFSFFEKFQSKDDADDNINMYLIIVIIIMIVNIIIIIFIIYFTRMKKVSLKSIPNNTNINIRRSLSRVSANNSTGMGFHPIR